jgi:hypothetical protein
MQHAYAVFGSRLHLVLEESVADAYNRFTDAFMQAQTNHMQEHGTQWDPETEPLLIKFAEDDKRIWSAVGNIINQLIELNGGGLELWPDECTSDYLVRL